MLGLVIVAFGWAIGESMLVRGLTDASDIEYSLGDAIMVGGAAGGLLLLVVGNIVLYLRYRGRKRDA